MEKMRGLINFKRVDGEAAGCASVAEALTILVIYSSSGNDLRMTLAVTAALVPYATLVAKGIEMSNNATRLIRERHKRIRL